MIKLGRREIMGGIACSCASFGFAHADNDEQFICSTVIPPIGDNANVQSANDLQTDTEIVIGPGDETETELSPQGVARSDLRWRPGDGLAAPNGVIRLGVGFVGNPSASWRNAVIERAMRWTPQGSRIAQRLIFDFNVPLENCQIRIAQTGVNGYRRANRSLLGRVARNNRLADGESTMYIYNLSSVEHEFGHALCLTHEHFHEALPVTIDRGLAIDYYRRTLGWSETTTVNNLFSDGERCLGDSSWNAESVMGYNIPAEITREGIGLTKSSSIHQRDRRCIDAIYL